MHKHTLALSYHVKGKLLRDVAWLAVVVLLATVQIKLWFEVGLLQIQFFGIQSLRLLFQIDTLPWGTTGMTFKALSESSQAEI